MLTKEAALDVLGLPSFATDTDILYRYRAVALKWFPVINGPKNDIALHEFSQVTKATITLLSGKPCIANQVDMTLSDLYRFFQLIFFGGRDPTYMDDDDDDNEEYQCSDELDDCYQCMACGSFDSATSSLGFEDVASDTSDLNATRRESGAALIEEEEKEKAKVEKRKAKKKRKREKKKLEKLAKESGNQNVPEKGASKTKVDDEKDEEESLSSGSEEEIDPTSAFVSVIAKKTQQKVPGVEVKEYDPVLRSINAVPKEDPKAILMRSRELAYRGNEMASAGFFQEAVELFNESLKLDPTDYRFYGNRSYCYDRLGQFERALKDAEKSISLYPEWAKGYFRKARALIGLKRFEESEKCFLKVLELDPECSEALPEIQKTKLLQIMDKGYARKNAEEALLMFGTVTGALNHLGKAPMPKVYMKSDDIFVSDDEEGFVVKPASKPKAAAATYDIKMDPNNPEGHNSLWIGNVQPDVTEKKLTSLFGKYGDLISVKAMPEKFCAFINYKNKTSPGKAMKALQAYELSGYKLIIRFPNLPGETTTIKKKATTATQEKVKGVVNGNECFYWRTTGCVYGKLCKNQHVPQNKGIDRK